MKNRVKKAAALLLTWVFLAGCTSPQDTQSQMQKQDKDELILAIGGEPADGFDPTVGWGRYGSPLFQSTLLKRDDSLKIINDVATGYTLSEDGLTWTFELRNDVKFSDGKPLTAGDVAFTYETAAKSGSVVDLSVLEFVKVVDKKVVFKLKQPQSTFVNIAVNLGIVPKHAYTKEYAMKPIGSGPYVFVQWDKGQQLIVERNEHYYDKLPVFKKITFLYLNEEAAFAAAQSGQVDIVAVNPTMVKQTVEGMVLMPVESVDNRGIAFPCAASGGKDADGFPVGNDVTADEAIRKAIHIAVNRKELVDGILNGYGTPAYTVCDKMPWWNDETIQQDGQIDEAKDILAKARWKDQDGDGILEKGGLKAQFPLVYPSSDPIRQSLAIAVADEMKPLGIQIDILGKSWDDIEKEMHSSAVLFGWGSHDPLEMYNLYHSKNAGIEYYNTGYYSNAAVDGYLDDALRAKTEEEAIASWKKAQWDGTTGFSGKGDTPWTWLVNLKHLFLVNEKLDIGNQRTQPHGHGWPITNNIADWHWKEK